MSFSTFFFFFFFFYFYYFFLRWTILNVIRPCLNTLETWRFCPLYPRKVKKGLEGFSLRFFALNLPRFTKKVFSRAVYLIANKYFTQIKWCYLNDDNTVCHKIVILKFRGLFTMKIKFLFKWNGFHRLLINRYTFQGKKTSSTIKDFKKTTQEKPDF